MFKGSIKRKSLAAALTLAILLVAAVGTAVAYLHHSSGSVVNAFKPAGVSVKINEEFTEGGSKKSVKVENTGDAAVYIRVAVVANTLNEDGEITGDVSDELTGKLPAEGWTKIGSYYYYSTPVNAGSSTGELLKENIDLFGYQVTILADGIQAYPAKAVTEAWPVSVNSEGALNPVKEQ